MKIELVKKENFWSLIDPENLDNVVVIMNENAPSIEINFDKLPDWAKNQILSSEESGTIAILDKPKQLVASNTADVEPEKKTKSKKVVKE